MSGGGDDSELANSSGGIIQGDEFLSLYINSQQSYGSGDRTNENNVRSTESSVLTPVRNRSHDTAAVSVELSAEPADSDDEDADDDVAQTRGSQNVVKLVTRGSRIVFIEDAPADTANVTQVTSVSVTSSEHRASSSSDSGDRIAIELDTDPDDEDDTETETDMDAKDSMNEASSNFETILQPPPSTTPIETLIVHDPPADYRSGASRPRSVSYSSVSQQTGALNNTSPPPQRPHISEPARVYGEPSKVYSEPARNYAEPERIYSEPARIYSEPARIYSEPARVYSEPAKVYSLPAQNYGEPAKVYGEPAKVYSLPAGSEDNGRPQTSSTARPTDVPSPAGTALIQNPASTSFHFGVHNVPSAKRIIFNLDKLPYDLLNAPVSDADNTNNSAGDSVGHKPRIHPLFAPQLDGQRFHQFTRKSYGQQFGALPSLPASSSNAEKATVSDGKPHDDGAGVADADTDGESATPAITTYGASMVAEPLPVDPRDTKVGFVLEGRNYRKYRVEEKTSDGFIVGEYGVVSNNDGSLRGVRYTADSTISPNLIYETLMKFLSL